MDPSRTVPKSFILRTLPALVLLAGFGITFAMWHAAKGDIERVQQAKFDFRVKHLLLDVNSRLTSYEQVLQSTAGLFASTPTVGRDAFRAFVNSLDLQENYPGIQGVGYALQVSPKERARHLDQMHRGGLSQYAIHPAGEREVYTPIIYLERPDRYDQSIGYDMFSEPVRQAAMFRARDVGHAVISSRLTLLQGNDKEVRGGFLMYVPIYRYQKPHNTVAERRANLVGWVFAPFRMKDLMRGIMGSHFGEVGESLDLDIYDGETVSPENQLYDSDQSAHEEFDHLHAAYRVLRQIEVAEHHWTLDVNSLPSFESAEEDLRLRVIPAVGGAGSVLLALVVWLLVSGRARAEQLAVKMNGGLIESEQQLKQAQAQAHIGSWNRNLLTNRYVWSEEMYRLFGLTPGRSDPDFQNFLAVVHPEDRDRVNRVVSDAVQKNEPFRMAYRIPIADGKVRHVVARGELEFDAAGRPIRTYGTVQDVTEQHLAEEKINRTLAELNDLYDHAPCGYHSLDGEGLIVRINQTELDWLGYTRKEVVGKMKLVEFFTPASQAVFRAGYPRFKETGYVHDQEMEMVRKDGSTFTVLVSATAICDMDGRFVTSRSTLYDISARKRAETELQRLNRFYSVLSQTNQAIIRIRDETDLYEEVCRIAVETGGLAMAWIGMLDEHSGEVVPLAHWGKEDGYLAYLMEKGVLRHNGPTAKAIHENHSSINDDTTMNQGMAPWRDEALKRGFRSSAAFPIRRAGKPVGTLAVYALHPHGFTVDIGGLFQDLAEDMSFALDAFDQEKLRWHAEDQLRLLNEQLELRIEDRTRQLQAANKELEAFSYSVSHDLRAPLRSIDGFSLVLQKSYQDQLDAKGQDYLGRIRRASQRMGELIDDMLMLSRVSRGKLDPEPVDISKMAREIADGLQSADPARKVMFDIADQIVVEADAKLLRIVLENLLGNAWKFTGKQAAARVELGREERDGMQAVFVRDNGAGFNMDYVHKLFNPFQRLHGMNEFEGTGIGLATVQRIIHRHGGQVWADSKEGEGATFYFSCASKHGNEHKEEME